MHWSSSPGPERLPPRRAEAARRQQDGVEGRDRPVRRHRPLSQRAKHGPSRYSVAAFGQQRGLAQQNLDVAYQDFLAQRGYPVEQLKILQSGLTGLPAVTSGTTTQTTPGTGFLGTASNVAGVLGGLKNLGFI